VTPWVLASLVGVLLATGCYTMIVHPKVDNERPDGDELRVACIDCHADYHVYPYDPYDTYFGSDYYWLHPRYGYYYGYPWWWDDYYWNYYFSPDDPDLYPPDPRDLSRAAYRGGLPHRAPGAAGDAGIAPPTVDSRGNPLLPRRGTDPAVGVLPGDTSGVDLPLRSPEMLTPVPGTQRVLGQPPWLRPSGGAGAKPPMLRLDSARTAGTKPAPVPTDGKSTTGATGTNGTTPATGDNPPKEESKPADTSERGRPKRKP
jgi:hypothetical protein